MRGIAGFVWFDVGKTHGAADRCHRCSTTTSRLCYSQGLLAGCSEGPAAPSSEDSPAVPEVSVAELQPAPLAVIRELPRRNEKVRDRS